jgi:hypothetical protein
MSTARSPEQPSREAADSRSPGVTFRSLGGTAMLMGGMLAGVGCPSGKFHSESQFTGGRISVGFGALADPVKSGVHVTPAASSAASKRSDA